MAIKAIFPSFENKLIGHMFLFLAASVTQSNCMHPNCVHNLQLDLRNVTWMLDFESKNVLSATDNIYIIKGTF